MQVGEIVGNYRIAGELGAGDVGAVYLAKHTLIGREAAIQVLPPELCGNAAAVAHFLSEAKTTAGIKHPGIVEVYDSGYTRDGRAYLVMERLEGESLGVRLRRRGQLSLEQAVAIARQVSGALYAAHKIGIVHRGLKPDSITMVPDPDVPGGERAKILDFGVAKLRESNEGSPGQKSGLEAAYLAPEQCDGSDRIDHRTDLYALGCILFELVCGRPPFDGKSHGVVLAQHMREAPPAPSSVEPTAGRDLDQLILRLLEKDPERRFPDAFELLTKFHELSGLAAPVAPAPGSITVLNTPPPDGPSGVANPTVSGVVSSARRTLAIGPRYRSGAQGALPRTVTVAAGTQRRKQPREDDTADPDDAHEETIDRDATQDDELPIAAAPGDPPFGPMLDESSRGGLMNDPSVDRLLPIPPPPTTPYTRQAMADAAMAASGPAPVGATQMMGSGSSGPPRSAPRIAPGTAAVPVSAAPPGPPPPPGSSGRPPGGGSGGSGGPPGPPPPPGSMGRTMAMPPGPPPGEPPGPPSGPPPSTQPAGKSREPFGGSGDLIMTLPSFSPGDTPGSPGGPPPGPHGGAPLGPHGAPPGPHGGPSGPHGGPPPGPHGSPPPGSFASPPPGGFPSPPHGSHGAPDPSAMGGPPFPPPFPPGPPGASSGPYGGPPPGPFGPGGPPPPAPPLGGPPPPAPPLGPGGPHDFAPPPHINAPPVFNEPFPRPMMRREDAMRAGMHVPPPRSTGTNSRAVRIGGLIVAVALAIGVVSAYVVATGDEDETETSAGEGTGATVAAAGATGKPAPAAMLDAGAAGDKVASAGAGTASDASAGDPAKSPAASDMTAGAAADAGALAAADKPAADNTTSAGDRSAADDKAGDDKAGDDKPAADKPADNKAASDKPAADKPAADDKVAAAGDGAADKPATDETAPADAPSDRAPSEPVEDKETRRRPAALITLQIDSLPRGAAVIRKRDGVRLGETPFTYQTEPQKSPLAIILRHRGYRDEVVTLPGNRSAERRVPLTRTDGRDRAPSLKD